MALIKEVQRIKSGYNPNTGNYKLTDSRIGERIDPARAASYKPIKRFAGSYAAGGEMGNESGQPDYYDPTIAGTTSRFSSVKFGKKLNSVLPYASNLVNSFRRLPQPAAPPVETAINPSLVNYDADRSAIDKDYRSFANETDYRIANPTISQAVKATAFGKRIQGMNQLAQQEGNTNAFITNQTNQANQGVQVRNIERQREFNNEKISRGINQQRLNSENFADFSDKVQLNQRDKALTDLENRKLDILPTLYKDTGVFDRNYSALSDEEKKALGKKKYGGAIKRRTY